MIESKPSVTARRVAMRRAAHQLIDAHPLILDDPIALRILEPDDAAALRAAPETVERGRFDRYIRAFMVARSRVAEDALAESVTRSGVRQYVVLGAGLDTFAYRNPYPELRVFEVDFPSTQAWKRERLATADIAIPDNLSFAPIDFEREKLTDVLLDAGLDASQPTFFSWLGVSPYLEPETVMSTLAAIAPLARGGGGVTFDYSVPLKSLPLMHRVALEALAKRVAQHGEPFRSYFEPDALAASLLSLGFERIEDLGRAELDARFFTGRSDALQAGSAGHILTACA